MGRDASETNGIGGENCIETDHRMIPCLTFHSLEYRLYGELQYLFAFFTSYKTFVCKKLVTVTVFESNKAFNAILI